MLSTKLSQFLDTKNLPTPFLVVDLAQVADRYRALKTALTSKNARYCNLYERSPYEFPLNLQVGDRVNIISTRAYTYSSIGFNGFPPLTVYCI
jgi:diaminopimelate decarboxylase